MLYPYDQVEENLRSFPSLDGRLTLTLSLALSRESFRPSENLLSPNGRERFDSSAYSTFIDAVLINLPIPDKIRRLMRGFLCRNFIAIQESREVELTINNLLILAELIEGNRQERLSYAVWEREITRNKDSSLYIAYCWLFAISTESQQQQFIAANQYRNFISCCANGNLKAACWLYHQVKDQSWYSWLFNSDREKQNKAQRVLLEINDGQAFIEALRHGKLEVAKWLWQKATQHGLQQKLLTVRSHGAFGAAIYRADLDMLKWLWSIATPEVQQNMLAESGFHYFITICRFAKGGTHVAKWLYEKAANREVKKAMLSASGFKAFVRACQYGHLELAKWLWEKVVELGLQSDLIGDMTQDLFSYLLCNDRVETLIWLLSLGNERIISLFAAEMCGDNLVAKVVLENFLKENLPNNLRPQQYKLLNIIYRYSEHLTAENLPCLLQLSDAEIDHFLSAFDNLTEEYGERVSAEKIHLIALAGKKAKHVEAMISGRLETIQQLREAVAACREILALEDESQELRVSHLRVINLFMRLSSSMSIRSLLRALLSLSYQDLTWVQREIRRNVTDIHDLLNSDSDLLVAPLAMRLVEYARLEQLYAAIPPLRRQELPAPGDYESSMQDRFILAARANISKLTRPDNFDLNEIELRIRRFLLEAILAEAEINPDDNQEIIVFINRNKESLARRSNKRLLQQAVGLFKDTASTAQTAWRAYEPVAQCVNWPNLLTQPGADQSDNKVFTTRATVQGTDLQEQTVTLGGASDDVRTLSALCFLATKDERLSEEERAALSKNFVFYIAEIRRAHNSAPQHTDNPSCYPGTVSRLGQILNVHPMFTREDEPEKIASAVCNHIRRLVQDVLAEMIGPYTLDIECRLILSAIHLYSPASTEHLIRDKNGIEYNISVTEADLRLYANIDSEFEMSDEDEQEALKRFVHEATMMRKTIIAALYGYDRNRVFASVVSMLQQRGIHLPVQMINYLIANALSDLPGLISLPSVLVEAATCHQAATEPMAAEVHPAQELYDRLLANYQSLIPEEPLLHIQDLLAVLFTSSVFNTDDREEISRLLHNNLARVRNNAEGLFDDEKALMQRIDRQVMWSIAGARQVCLTRAYNAVTAVSAARFVRHVPRSHEPCHQRMIL